MEFLLIGLVFFANIVLLPFSLYDNWQQKRYLKKWRKEHPDAYSAYIDKQGNLTDPRNDPYYISGMR